MCIVSGCEKGLRIEGGHTLSSIANQFRSIKNELKFILLRNDSDFCVILSQKQSLLYVETRIDCKCRYFAR